MPYTSHMNETETWVLTVTTDGQWVATVRIEGVDEDAADVACVVLLRGYARRGLAVQVEPKRT